LGTAATSISREIGEILGKVCYENAGISARLGGIETCRRQAAGAAWERVDTRFAAAEAGAHPTYVQALMAAE
jgi:hypothetical protein